MQLRLRFLGALLAVLGGAGVTSAAPTLTDAWTERQVDAVVKGVPWPDNVFDAEVRRAASEFERAAPAAQALARVDLPGGVHQCKGAEPGSVAQSHAICWEGEGEPVPTAVALTRGLRKIGAEAVAPRCVEKTWDARPSLVLCEVTATILGQGFRVSLGPLPGPNSDTHQWHGVFVAGGIGSETQMTALRLPASATPIPLPVG